MHTLILIVHILACLFLILAVLMQSGKGSAAGIFGGSGAENLFGGPTAFNFLNKFTAVVAVVMFITSITLTVISEKHGMTSVVDKIKVPVSSQQHN